MLRRVILKLISLPVDGLITFSRKLVPGSPLRCSLTYPTALSVIIESSMLSITSPFFSPTSAAGMCS